MEKIFLTARWEKLLMANYAVDPAALLPYLPAHVELDLWEGRAMASMVGFLFCDTRIKGIAFPFHRNFEEVNLRFYVKRRVGDEWHRGVVFISEIVPKPAIVWVANTLYNEHYTWMPMRNQINMQEALSVQYDWKYKRQWNRLSATAAIETEPIAIGSEAEFILEHYWGYSRINNTTTRQYQVQHPRWRIHPVRSFEFEANTGLLYGDAFAGLAKQTPQSVFLAEGSAVSVKIGEIIR
jgi:uncharacterized protein